MAEQPESDKVKVQYYTDPSRIRYVTHEAAGYLAPKWILSDDQSQPAKKKDVAPVASVRDRKPELRELYKKLTGEEADPVWNEARLFVENAKAEKRLETKTEVEEIEVETPGDIPSEAPKKRGPKPKVKE